MFSWIKCCKYIDLNQQVKPLLLALCSFENLNMFIISMLCKKYAFVRIDQIEIIPTKNWNKKLYRIETLCVSQKTLNVALLESEGFSPQGFGII